MSKHFKVNSAIFPLIFRANKNSMEVLLHRRQHTGYMDGKWDLAGSGHVDEGETPQVAVIRECKEELGIDIQSKDLAFALISHRRSSDENSTYYDLYFVVNKYVGMPTIMEPEKCQELKWFDINKLPFDIIECRRVAIESYKNKVHYNEVTEWG